MNLKLNPEQQQAVEYLSGPLLVLAGPGTGKTQLLSAKVAYILEHTDTNPENILCITFTEAAAANMRSRLVSIIGAAAHKVNISTYHSFGRDILAAYNNYNGQTGRRFDNPIDEITQFKIIQDIQSALKSSDILKVDRVKDIVDVIKSAKSARLTADDLAVIAETNIKDSEVLSRVTSEFLAKIQPYKNEHNLNNFYLPIFEILKNHRNDPEIIGRIPRNIQGLATELESALEVAQATNSSKTLTAWRNQFFEKDARGTWRLKDRVANKKLASLANIMQQYQAYLEKNHLVDFADMIEESIVALQNDRGFRLTLSERFQFILLDEFQDTNPSQFEIIRQLTDYENPVVMAVGDDDQAIFEFQGASASSLSAFKKHYSAKVINLVHNYRNTQPILDFSRRIIDQVDDSFIKTQPELGLNKTLLSHNKTPTTLERHDFLIAESEYFWVAERIKELVEQGVPQSEIAVIAPKHKYILAFLPYLKAHPEVQISYEKRENLFEDPYIHQILSIARFVYLTANTKPTNHLLLEILGFDFWQIEPSLALKTVNQAEKDHQSALTLVANAEDPKLRAAGQFLSELAIKSFDLPFELLLDLIIGTTSFPNSDFTSPFLSYYSAHQDPATMLQIYEALHVLKNKLSEHLAIENPKLADLITFLNNYEAANAPLTITSPYRESLDSVQLLSIHKAKGMEFTYVFLISLDNTAWGKSKGNHNLLSLPANMVSIRPTGSTDSERLRNLFVAITRAKSGLYLTSSRKNFSDKSTKPLEYLAEFENQDGQNISPYLPADHQLIIEHQETLSDAQKCRNLQTSWSASYRTPTPALLPIIQQRAEKFRLYATAFRDFIDIAYAGPINFYERYLLRAPSAPADLSLKYGSLIHLVFEAVTKEKLSDAEAVELLRSEIAKLPISAEEIADFSETWSDNLKVALKAFGTDLRAEDRQAEVGFYRENISLDGVPITGQIDHLKIDKTHKTVEIYDFKTGKYKDNKNWFSDASLLRYLLQLNFYRALIENSPNFRGYSVEKGHILFVTPDQDGLVHDKVYIYNDADYELFRKLLKSVYAHIQALDFINPDSPLAIEPDADRNHKDIKAFIDQLI